MDNVTDRTTATTTRCMLKKLSKVCHEGIVERILNGDCMFKMTRSVSQAVAIVYQHPTRIRARRQSTSTGRNEPNSTLHAKHASSRSRQWNGYDLWWKCHMPNSSQRTIHAYNSTSAYIYFEPILFLFVLIWCINVLHGIYWSNVIQRLLLNLLKMKKK